MRRNARIRASSCTVLDEGLPGCNSGPIDQVRFVARELAGIALGILSMVRHRPTSSGNDKSGNPEANPTDVHIRDEGRKAL
ncbi:MAG: hypothetical protein M1115_06090 [Actinobacteria bacterium]|nr:hypothetical protein [Actinomycetota bacterium]